MTSHIILQSGQIWMPHEGAGQLPRRIVDLPEGMLAYQTVSIPSQTVRGKGYLVSQSTFRRWMRLHNAALHAEGEGRAAPAAELAQKIVTLRRSAGVTQEEMARALGISRSAVAAMETGRTSRAHLHLPRLAALFQVPVDFFLTGMVEENVTMTLGADEADLVDLYRRLSPELKITVQKYVERQTRKIS
ncbi:helix-turn-helix domain-containing protein [Acetobacter sp.]|jgi:transcriptional regulator with XRE-family HTH domain|uniref:helix-turn-helix domain-containing protein n=1 Tax=Acetobacter sp. TaxID=440 RepID=UPI0025BCE886|nr:helix-turn-helix transcriptional regulator [Acetobacter sp.]MCH4091216.1 helix-turn-helix domain-containing protein [Acetobacter sp.]